MAGDSANAVLSVIAQSVITPFVNAIGRQFGYICFYNRNINNLKQRVVRLEDSIKDTKILFQSQSWNSEETTHSSTGWLQNAEEVAKTANEIMKDKEQLKGWCVNLKGRYVLSRKSEKTVTKIQELENKAPSLDAKNCILPAAKLHGSSSNDASKDFKTRMKVMDKVIEALKDDNINIIGICGLGGIGKTTILHEVRERVTSTHKIFDEVAMTTVSQDQKIFNIQSDLASMLGLTRIKDEGNIIARADLLHKRLTNGSKILVILDDIWNAIKLKEVGIPIENDRAKCKVLLASRYKSVCTGMGTQETILVEELSKEEAWRLFKKTVGECVEKDKLEKIAKEVADECGGLPIALVTLARALSNKNKGLWEHSLTQLRQSNVTAIPSMNKEVYPSIKLSYDFLASELLEAQPFLLICCQHAEDAEIKVEKLARYCLALELFKNVDNLVDVRNRTYAVIDHLSSCFLLQVVDVDEEEKHETVKMHDVVRDVCLSILSVMKEERDKVYMHIMGPDKDGDCDYGEVDYSKVKILMKAPLAGDISFLQSMKELRVFENSRDEKDIQEPALHVLENLRMLSLENKPLSEDIMSSIGSLSRLEILSFWRSEITSFPRQICQLSNLKLLDLRCEVGEGRIPSGILLGLKKLEVLCMGKFLLLGATKDEDMQTGESYGCITELDSLSNLTTLQINLVDPSNLLDLPHFQFEKLEKFYLGSFWDYNYMKRSRTRSLVQKTIRLKDILGMEWVLKAKIQYIVTNTVILGLSEIEGWNDPYILEKFVSIRELSLSNCRQLEYVLPGRSLGELWRLVLTDMPMMRQVCVVPTNLMCLGNLRNIHILNCPVLESVFPRSAAKCLVQLEELSISECQTLGGIVSKEKLGIISTSGEAEIKEESSNDFIILFLKLRKLYLDDLPEFCSLYNLKLEDGTEQPPLLNPLVMLPSLEKLNCTRLPKLKQIHVGGGIQNLEDVTVIRCDSLETVFDFEENANNVLPNLCNLKRVYLLKLPNMEHFCRRIPQGIQPFQNLQELTVRHCGRLDYLISSSMAHMLVNLEILEIERCEDMKKVIKMNELDSKKIVLPSLRHLSLNDMEELSSFCSTGKQELELTLFNQLVMFPSLETLQCWNLQHLKDIFGGGIHSFQNLTHLRVYNCHNLSYLIPSFMAHMLVNLKTLEVSYCDSMKEVIKMNEDCGMKKIVFSSLSILLLQNLGQLSSFCSHDQQSFEFPSLEHVFVQNCPKMKTFCCGHLTAEKFHGVKTSYPDYGDEQTPIWKGGLNETVQHLNTRVNQMKSDGEEDGVREERITDECTNEDGNVGSSSTPPEQVQISQDTSKKASTPISVVPSSPPVSINNEELANSSSPDLIKASLSPIIELLPSASMERSVHSSNSPEQPKADTELSDMSLLSQDDDWKRCRILIRGVYVRAELKTTFEEILTAQPNFLSGLRSKMAMMKTGAVESAIRSLQILRQRTALTISTEELAYVKDSLDDIEMSGLDTAWLERGYQRAILVMKEKKVVSAAAELAMLEKKKTEDEVAFEMAREQLEASIARRDAYKAEYDALMRELEAGKELFGDDFDLETSLGDGLLN